MDKDKKDAVMNTKAKFYVIGNSWNMWSHTRIVPFTSFPHYPITPMHTGGAL